MNPTSSKCIYEEWVEFSAESIFKQSHYLVPNKSKSLFQTCVYNPVIPNEKLSMFWIACSLVPGYLDCSHAMKWYVNKAMEFFAFPEKKAAYELNQLAHFQYFGQMS